MDLGPEPTDHDDFIQRYGRRLFVLAYHLTGDAAEAGELSRECLVRSLLAPDFPANDREAGVFLHRGLISLWRERAGHPDRGAVPPAAGRAAAARAPREHAALWRALSRLDPVSRAVFVLRVAEGLEYETIGKVLDMAPDVVYARLLQARGGLHIGDRALEESLFETLNLYLDDRLPGDRRGAFEKRLKTDAALRERVEFHRGLTLELHEEAPALPRDFTGRLRERLDQARQVFALVDQAGQASGWAPSTPTGSPGPPTNRWRRLPLWVAAITGAVALLVIGVALGLWVARRRPAAAPAPWPESGRAGDSAGPGATPDEATIEALRSLGYLAPGRPAPTPPAAKKSPPSQGRTFRKPVPEAATQPTIPSPSPSESPPAAASPTPAEPAVLTATPSPPPAETASGGSAVTWRVIPVTKSPEPGRDPQIIRTAPEWSALFEGTGAPPPELAFDKEMAVLLRHGLPDDPPADLVVVSVTGTSEELVIECRKEPPKPGAGPGLAGPAGQAVVVPIFDLPVRVVVR